MVETTINLNHLRQWRQCQTGFKWDLHGLWVDAKIWEMPDGGASVFCIVWHKSAVSRKDDSLKICPTPRSIFFLIPVMIPYYLIWQTIVLNWRPWQEVIIQLLTSWLVKEAFISWLVPLALEISITQHRRLSQIRKWDVKVSTKADGYNIYLRL